MFDPLKDNCDVCGKSLQGNPKRLGVCRKVLTICESCMEKVRKSMNDPVGIEVPGLAEALDKTEMSPMENYTWTSSVRSAD